MDTEFITKLEEFLSSEIKTVGPGSCLESAHIGWTVYCFRELDHKGPHVARVRTGIFCWPNKESK